VYARRKFNLLPVHIIDPPEIAYHTYSSFILYLISNNFLFIILVYRRKKEEKANRTKNFDDVVVFCCV
jgi:hypothetical protein